MQKQARRVLDAKAASSTLGYRADFAKAFYAGESVLEGPASKARNEMAALVAEVLRMVR
jgi:hypothetical protein